MSGVNANQPSLSQTFLHELLIMLLLQEEAGSIESQTGEKGKPTRGRRAFHCPCDSVKI